MATTPVLALPYPIGTDRIMDGDNVIQALAERIEARLPRGYMQRADLTANLGPFATRGDAAGLTMTVSLTAGRWYRARVRGYAGITVANGRAGVFLMLDGTQIHGWQEDISVSNFASFECVQEFQVGSTGSHVIKVQAEGIAGQMNFIATTVQKTSLVLEDLGTLP